MSWMEGNGVPAFSRPAIFWSMLMLVAWLPLEICPVQSEAIPASCDPWAALFMIPSRTITLLCKFVVQEVLVPLAVTFPPMAKGASVLRKMKFVVWVGALPAAGGRTSLPLASVAPQSGRTQPHG